MSSNPSMQADDLSTVIILIAAALVLLGFLLAMAFEILRWLTRIERRVEEISERHEGGAHAVSATESLPGGAFETFLAEDPARRLLPKAEQFAAYRKWRQENGLNWPNA